MMRCGAGRGAEDVHVADGRAPAAQRARGLDLVNGDAARAQLIDQRLGERPRHRDEDAIVARALLQRGQALAQLLDRFRPEAGHRGHAPGVERLGERGDAVDAQGLVEREGGLRADVGDGGEGDQPRGDLGTEAVVESQPPGAQELVDLAADRFAHVRQVAQLPGVPDGADVVGHVQQRIGGAPVRLDLEAVLAFELEHRGDLEHDLGDGAVGDARRGRQVRGRRKVFLGLGALAGHRGSGSRGLRRCSRRRACRSRRCRDSPRRPAGRRSGRRSRSSHTRRPRR